MQIHLDMTSDEFYTLIGGQENNPKVGNDEESSDAQFEQSIGQEMTEIKTDDNNLNSNLRCGEDKRSTSTGEIDTKSKQQCTLIGLHTCGDLASTMLKLFKKTKHIKNIVSVSCCYFRMTLESETGNEQMKNRDSNHHTKVCCAAGQNDDKAERLCCCNFSLKTLYSNLKYLQLQNNTMDKHDDDGGVSGDFYGFPLSDFIHRIPVTPLKYKSFETACHFLGDYADKLLGQ